MPARGFALENVMGRENMVQKYAARAVARAARSEEDQAFFVEGDRLAGFGFAAGPGRSAEISSRISAN